MIIVMDVGNTNTVIGVYDGTVLAGDWRIRTDRNRTGDEFGVLASNLLSGSGFCPKNFDRAVISSVVPPMAPVLDAFCRKHLGCEPLWVDAKSAGMPILCKNPSEVGADRIVNSVAAFEKYKTSLIVIDFGTATTFDAVSEKGEFLGGAISPGIMISAEALFGRASKLPRVEILTPPQRVIGKDTSESMQSGIIFGYAGLVDGIARRMGDEMGTASKVVATGGLAPLMSGVCDTIDFADSSLTLEGLRLIYEKEKAENEVSYSKNMANEPI